MNYKIHISIEEGSDKDGYRVVRDECVTAANREAAEDAVDAMRLCAADPFADALEAEDDEAEDDETVIWNTNPVMP